MEKTIGISAIERRRRRNRTINTVFRYVVLIFVAIIMIYPILWLIGASFKTNNEIFTSLGFIPSKLDFTAYIEGWNTKTQYTFTTFFKNTFLIVIPKVLFCIASSVIVAYGFARFEFPMKKIFFSLLMATMFLPAVVTRIPLYIMWKGFGVLDTYIPLIAPTVFANEPFFVFMLIQFLRSVPTYLDEAATIDGCNSFQTLIRVILPTIKPAIISCVIFQFIWSFNDFLGPLIYVTSLEKYPVSLALKMSIDQSSGIVEWNQILAMSFIALLPAIILFFCAQKYFVEGIAASGVKG
nr:carbohydrate ABC transporter permease [uncultured Blautia sp.]